MSRLLAPLLLLVSLASPMWRPALGASDGPAKAGRHSLAEAARPNIIFIQTDDQAAWTIGRDGNREARTPNLDRLIGEGAWLRNSFVVTPVCSPSRASLLTGRYGTELGITDWINPKLEPSLGLDPATPTWTKLLSEAGYATALVGKWHLGTEDRFLPRFFGFHHFTGFRAGGTTPRDPTLDVEGRPETLKGFTVDLLTDAALGFLRAQGDRPFLLMLNYREPHAPYLPVPDADWARFSDLDSTLPEPGYPNLDVPLAKRLMREYLASVAAVDRNVGRVLQAVDERGIEGNTIVIFTSDHGYNIGHHGIWHKGNGHWITTEFSALANTDPRKQRPNMFDTSLRVPTTVRWPGVIRPGTSVDSTVTNLDWFRTLLAAARVPLARPTAGTVRGRNILPALKGQPLRGGDEFYAQYSQHHYTQTDLRAYRTRQWKLVRDFRNPGRDELYDLAVDPGERENLIDAPRAQSARRALNDKLLARMRAIGDPVLMERRRAAAAPRYGAER